MPLSRRAFLGAAAAASVGAVVPEFSRASGPPRAAAGPWQSASGGPGLQTGPRALRVDAARLRQRIEALSVFGRPANGTFADGVSRVAYSDADLAGRKYVMDLMRAATLEPRIDPAGNIFGRRAGRDASAPPILFGSHIDSVPRGGNFDGDLGSLAALGAIEALAAAGITTRHPLEMVVWSAEEGVAFGRGLAGSRIVAGDLQPADMEAVWNGLRRADAIRTIGGQPERIEQAVRSKGAHHAYLELHIEQGGNLDRDRIPVGVVEGIVAIHRYTAVVTGFSNHAGTTPMPERKDALVAASQLAVAVREIVMREPGRQVGTVGRFDVTPNAPNVIPGEVSMTIELRDLSPEKLLRIADAIKSHATEIARATETTIAIRDLSRNPPALASSDVQAVIERAAASLSLQTTRMPSGAGHDAQMMAQLSPMGMIFVPSLAGISHSPRELTSWQDCANGANVLLSAVMEVDAK